MLPYWLSKCFFWRPTASNSHENCGVLDSGLACPLSNTMSLTVECNQMDAVGVLSLFQRSSPSAILRGVSQRSIFSVNRMNVTRAFSHVLKEILKRSNPSITNGNAFCTIQIVILVILVVASPFNVLPALVLGRPTIADATAVLEWSTIFGRLVRRHSSTPFQLYCVRSAGRPQSSGCSHYYALLFDQMQSVTLCHKNPGRQVQHISQA